MKEASTTSDAYAVFTNDAGEPHGSDGWRRRLAVVTFWRRLGLSGAAGRSKALLFVDTAKHALATCEDGRATSTFTVRLGRKERGRRAKVTARPRWAPTPLMNRGRRCHTESSCLSAIRRQSNVAQASQAARSACMVPIAGSDGPECSRICSTRRTAASGSRPTTRYPGSPRGFARGKSGQSS